MFKLPLATGCSENKMVFFFFTTTIHIDARYLQKVLTQYLCTVTLFGGHFPKDLRQPKVRERWQNMENI